MRSTWGTSLGGDKRGARARILNTKVVRQACAGQTFPPPVSSFSSDVQARIRTTKDVRSSPPPPLAGPTRPPPALPTHLKKNLFGAFNANVLCVPQGHVQGVSQLFTWNGTSQWKWTVMD